MTETTGARVLEGTWDEIVANSNGNLSGKRVFILVLEGAGQTAHYTNGHSSSERERHAVESFGMFAHLPISSEDFASREQEEIAREGAPRASEDTPPTEKPVLRPSFLGKYKHIIGSMDEYLERKRQDNELQETKFERLHALGG